MKSQLQTNVAALSNPVLKGGMLQRSCACGNHTIAGAMCSACNKQPDAWKPFPTERNQPASDATPRITDSHSGPAHKRTRPMKRLLLGLQAKMTVSQSGDQFEQEADRVAEHVMQITQPGPSPGRSNGGRRSSPQLRRARGPKNLKRHAEDESGEQQLLLKAESANSAEISSATQTRIQSLKGAGEPLSPASRAFFEPRFGHDFSRVRIHTDSRAAETARDVRAHAFTLGQDIVFASGQYAPESISGQKLLAHELTHVIQQEETATDAWASPISLRTHSTVVQRANAADRRLPNDQAEAIAFATAAETEIVAANGRLAAAADPARRNVPAFIAQQGITLQALTPRHDNTVGLSPLNFFAGQVNYADTVTLSDHTTHHINGARNAARIRARDHTNIDNMLPPAEIERRLVQAISEIAYTASLGRAATVFDIYRAQFNGFWDAPAFSGVPAAFDPALPSKGPRTRRANAIFQQIYQDDPTFRAAYDANTLGIREKVDAYAGPEGLNPINSPRLQSLRAAFFPFAVPISNANYPAFRAAITAVAATLEDVDRRTVELSNDWQKLINKHLTADAKRQEIRSIIATPPPAAAPAPVAPPVVVAPPVPGGGGGGVTPQQFVDSISIDGPVAPVPGNNRTEQVTLTPLSTLANPAVAIDTRLTVTPQPQVQGANVSPVSPWPNAALSGVPFQVDVINNGLANMNAHLDLLNGPAGLAPSVPIPDLAFQVQDNRQANFIANWFTDVLVNTGAGQDWQGNIVSAGGQVFYRGGTQTFGVGAFVPSPQTNPGLTLFVKVVLKRGAAVLAAPAALAPFPADADHIVPIPININAPAAVPVAGDNLRFEIDLIAADRVTVLNSKVVLMTVMPEQVYTKAQAIAAATADEAHLNDATPGGLLDQMTTMGGLAARVSSAIQVAPPAPRIRLRALTVRHDSRAYVTAVTGGPHPDQVGYFVGTTYNNAPPDSAHSFADVTGAAAMFIPSGFGPRFIVANRTTDVFTGAQRSDPDLIRFIVHEAVHAMDVRPGAGTDIERYKTEFRAYWMDGRFGPPNQGTCPPAVPPFAGPCPPIGAPCYDTTYLPDLPPPGPKSCRARAIFSQQLYGSATYPFVKPAYDNNTSGFRDAVDNYLIPDGINLISSVRLESLRQLIAGGVVGGFAAWRDKVRAFRGQGPGPAPAVGVLDADEENEINRNRAWRDLVNAHVGVPAQRNQIKADLNIPT